MSDTVVLINTGVAVLAVVLLIVRFRLNPVVALVLGSAYLGLSTGLGVEGTVKAITGGFGEIMAEVGLLIAFGVLTGAILQEIGAIERLVATLLRVFGPKRMPYALSVTIATALQSIYLDVLLVISAPLARNLAPRIGKLGLARMATALAIGLECGIVLMVPGVGTLALAGLLGVPLGKMLVFGLILVVPTVIIAVAIMSFLFRKGWWDPAKDEGRIDQAAIEDGEESAPQPRPGVTSAERPDDAGAPAAVAVDVAADPAVEERRHVRLIVLFAPLLGALLLIGVGAITEIAAFQNPVVDFLSEPVIALLLGMVGTSLVGRYTAGRKRIERAIGAGFRESGQILILTAVGGSLAATIKEAGLGDILGQYFTAQTAAPLLMVWVIAAVLHVAVGSVTISAITAAGILAPVAPVIGLDPVLIALAAGAGSLFAVHVTSNTFWLLQSLMGQTTRGTLKTCSVGVSIASVVAILLVLPLSLVV
ncbi:H+/gluconate symporter-like permease [Pseudonocardia hierapolitana]|uniref:H+/gluconate symporter-like permease n=1 Tax=Pseudonocardia hierapolitana TaxID=1128676 RepID=A0A561T0C7_9PSEU|nr:SLC13 family permease [Pseudonocardia hierapolitana]TWF80564.1 H+/gluconate symporter-like permease [Pseudonocardia hierapolitana]